MKKLNKKSIIIIAVSIVLILAIIIGVVLSGSDTKKASKNDTKIEQQEQEDADDKDKKENAEEEESEAVETETETETETEEQTENNVVEEPEQQTTQQQGSSNSNQNPNNNNVNNNSGGGTTTPSNPTPTPTPEPEKSPYAGMYHPKDAFAIERLDKCANILKGGLVGDARYEYNMVDYFDGHIAISASNTSGAWMYITIGYWDTNGANNTDEMKAVFNEIPVLMKQCFEALAPEGGAELYNTTNSLIHQYGGPRKVPTQGVIQESIPGLFVEVTKGKGGLELRFFAE